MAYNPKSMIVRKLVITIISNGTIINPNNNANNTFLNGKSNLENANAPTIVVNEQIDI